MRVSRILINVLAHTFRCRRRSSVAGAQSPFRDHPGDPRGLSIALIWSMLATLPSMKQKIAVARANGWKRYPSLFIGDVANDAMQTQVIFDAIEILLRFGSAIDEDV